MTKKSIVSSLAVSGILGCFVWMYFEPGFEPAIGIVTGLSILIADYLPDADYSKWRNRRGVLAVSSLLVFLVLGLLVYLGFHLNDTSDDESLRKVHINLYDTSKDMLRVLQPSEGNTFSQTDGLAESMKAIAEQQLIPQKMVEILPDFPNVIGEDDVTFKLTEYGKKVRAYLLNNEQQKKPEDILLPVNK